MKISLITVVKNDKENISKTIKSVLDQSYLNIEYIIIDGYSTDGTFQQIKKLIKKKNIKLFKKRDNSMYEAINYGINIASGEIIGLLHSGDTFYNSLVLSKIIKYFKKYNLISGNITYRNNLNKVIRIWNFKLNKLNVYSSYKIPHTSLFLKKSLFSSTGLYDVSYKISSDTEFLLRISRNPEIKYKYINRYIINMSYNGLSTSNKTIFIKIYEDLKIYFKYFNLFFLYFYLKKILFKTQNYLKWKFLK